MASPQTWNSAGAGEEDQHAASLVEGHRHFEGAGARQWQHRATLYWNLGPGGRVWAHAIESHVQVVVRQAVRLQAELSC